MHEEKTIEKIEIFKGKIISLSKHTVKLENDKISYREVVNHPGGVVILAFKDNGKILFVKQFRKPIEKEIIELPAGKIEKGEDIKRTAIRELEEETGFTTNKITYLGKIVSSPGFCDEYIHIYKAEELCKGTFSKDEDEFLDVLEFTLEEALEMIKSNEIIDAKTICAFSLI